MRVTDHFSTQQAIAAFAASRERMNATYDQVTSGHRVQKASDDPGAARSIMENDSEQRAIAQKKRNFDAATSRLNSEEGALDQLTNLLTRAKELAVSQASDTSNPAGRQASAKEVNELLAQAVELANTTHNREYLFGGAYSTTPPYTIDTSTPVYTFTVATPAPQGPLMVDVGGTQLMPTSHDGVTVFGGAASGVLASLQNLATALNTGDKVAIANAIPSIDTSIDTAQTLTSEVGAWTNRMESSQATQTALDAQLTASTTQLRDVDMESAITELVSRQTALQAAMAATARIFGTSLTDYLQ